MTDRTRKIYRLTGLAASIIIIAAIAAVTILHYRGNARLRRTAEKIDRAIGHRDPAAFEKPYIPDELNAARWIAAGAGAVVWSSEERDSISDASLLPYSQWSEQLKTDVRAILANHRSALEILHRAAQLEMSSFGIQYSQGMRAEIPDLVALVRVSRLLMAEARVAFNDGDRDCGLNALATLSRLAASLQEESTIVTALVGIACERAMLVTAAEVAGSGQSWAADPEFLGQLEAVIPTNDTTELLREVFAYWAAVIGDPETRQGALMPSERSLRNTAHTHLFGESTLADILERRLEMLELLTIPCGSDPERFDPRQGVIHEGFADLRGLLHAIGRFQAVNAQRQLLRAAVEMRRIAHSDGFYPAERPGIRELSEPDPFTGKPLEYTLHDDGSLELALVGATELLERIVAGKSVADMLVPITLPHPAVSNGASS